MLKIAHRQGCLEEETRKRLSEGDVRNITKEKTSKIKLEE